MFEMKRSLLPIGLSIAALALAGCGSSDDSVSIEHAWARSSAAGQTTGAVYFDLTVDEADTLLGASVPASIAADAQIHEVVMADTAADDLHDMHSGDMGDMDEMDSGETGAMTMRELADGLPLAAGDTVQFEPGSYHVMLLDLVEPLEVGDTIEVTLDFATADDVTLTVQVAESAP